MSSDTSNTGKIIAGAVLAVLVIVYGSMALYRGSWDLANANAARSYQLAQKNTNRQAHIDQSNYGAQKGFQAAVEQNISAAVGDVAQIPGAPDGAALKVEAINAGDKACYWANQLVPSALPIPPQMEGWIKANCSFGTLSLHSPIRSGTGA